MSPLPVTDELAFLRVGLPFPFVPRPGVHIADGPMMPGREKC
jgi:hypothetical protein